MASVNKVTLIGHLGRDPETRRMASGDPVVSFSLATAESWKDKATGERKDRTEWHQIVIFNEGLAKVAEQYLRKGSKCYLEGQQCTRQYTDKDGVQRKVTEVVLQKFRGELVLLDKQERQAPEPDSYGTTSSRDAGPRPGDSRPMSSQIDDDIPF